MYSVVISNTGPSLAKQLILESGQSGNLSFLQSVPIPSIQNPGVQHHYLGDLAPGSVTHVDVEFLALPTNDSFLNELNLRTSGHDGSASNNTLSIVTRLSTTNDFDGDWIEFEGVAAWV